MLDLVVLPGLLAVCRLPPDCALPSWFADSVLSSVTRSADETSIFALSTYDTDYVLVKESALTDAVTALSSAGHRIEQGVSIQRVTLTRATPRPFAVSWTPSVNALNVRAQDSSG
jgi:hypothetical protein